MNTQEDLTQLIVHLRGLCATDIGLAIKESIDAFPPNAPKADMLRGLQGQLNEANKSKLRGTISTEDLTLEYNRIRANLLGLISGLELKDFLPVPSGRAKKRPQQGHLLYHIPRSMPLNKESRCVVRLGFEEDVLVQNIELTDDHSLQSIRIAEVMEVALVDDNSVPTFQIRTISSGEQFVEHGAYTEWIFKVTPLRQGSYPLVLRIAVLQLVAGKERRKEIVLEETIEIVAEDNQPEALEPAFMQTGIIAGPEPYDELREIWETGGTVYPYLADPVKSISKKEKPNIPPPGPPRPLPKITVTEPSPPAKGTNARRFSLRKLSMVAGFALLATASIWYVNLSSRGPNFDVSHPAPALPDEGSETGSEPTEGTDSPELFPDSLLRDTIIQQ